MSRSRHGVAVPLLLCLLLAMTLLAHAALVLSQQELRATWALRHAYRASEAAEAGLRAGLGGWARLREERIPLAAHAMVSGQGREGLHFRANLRWIDEEFFLLEATGGSTGWGGEVRRGSVGWALNPYARLGAIEAMAEVGGEFAAEGSGRLDGGRLRDIPGGWQTSACADLHSSLDSIFPRGPPQAIGPLSGPAPEELGSQSPIPPLGLLTGYPLLALAEGELESGGTPLAADSVHGCPGGSGPEFLGASGSATLEGGRLCGVLVIEGDLRIQGGARFQGLALVGGDLLLEGNAVLEGVARVAGDLRLRDHSQFQGSACSMFRALQELPALARPYLLPWASNLTAF